MSYEKFDVNNNHQFVLEIDNEVVGFVTLGYLKMGVENLWRNLRFIYNKKWSNGFGRKLVEKTIKEIKQLGCNKMIIAMS